MFFVLALDRVSCSLLLILRLLLVLLLVLVVGSWLVGLVRVIVTCPSSYY